MFGIVIHKSPLFGLRTLGYYRQLTTGEIISGVAVVLKKH